MILEVKKSPKDATYTVTVTLNYKSSVIWWINICSLPMTQSETFWYNSPSTLRLSHLMFVQFLYFFLPLWLLILLLVLFQLVSIFASFSICICLFLVIIIAFISLYAHVPCKYNIITFLIQIMSYYLFYNYPNVYLSLSHIWNIILVNSREYYY